MGFQKLSFLMETWMKKRKIEAFGPISQERIAMQKRPPTVASTEQAYSEPPQIDLDPAIVREQL